MKEELLSWRSLPGGVSPTFKFSLVHEEFKGKEYKFEADAVKGFAEVD